MNELNHEREMTRLEIQCKHWFITALTALVLLIAESAALIAHLLH